MKIKYYLIILLVVLLISLYFIYIKYLKVKPITPVNNLPAAVSPVPISISNSEPSLNDNVLQEPVKDFRTRITKKPFGIYITPANSPIQPEKYTGYHAGVDAEYDDISEDTPVYAVSDGIVEYSGTVGGYGGVLVIREKINSDEILCLYGHLASSSLTEKGKTVKKGEIIGRLGNSYSEETSGERKHLHFAILKGTNIDYRGYVQNKEELNIWYDPLDYFR